MLKFSKMRGSKAFSNSCVFRSVVFNPSGKLYSLIPVRCIHLFRRRTHLNHRSRLDITGRKTNTSAIKSELELAAAGAQCPRLLPWAFAFLGMYFM